MTLDTSAVLAVLQDEAERAEFVSLIEQSSRRLDLSGIRARSGNGSGRAKRRRRRRRP